MPLRALQYERLEYNEGTTIPPGDAVDPLVWSSGPTTEGVWPGSPPDAPATEVVANGPSGRVHLHIGGFANSPTGSFTIELKRNGTTVDTVTFTDNGVGTWYADLFYPPLGPGGWPVQTLITAGDVFTAAATNNLDVLVPGGGTLDVSDDESEEGLYLRIEENYGTPITETGLCDDLFVTQPGSNEVLSYVSSTQVPGTTYTMPEDTQPFWIGFKSSEEDFGVTGYQGDLERSTVSDFAVGASAASATVNRTSIIDGGYPFAIEYDGDDTQYLLGWKDDELRLHKLDTGGTVLNTWVVSSNGSGPGAVLALDVASDGKAYYIEVGGLNVDGKAYLYCFDMISGTQKPPALTLDAGDGGNRDWFGAFRLLMGDQGGCVISRREFTRDLDTFLYARTWLDLYDKNGTLFNQVPVEDGRPTSIGDSYSTSADVTPSLCFGESMQLIWAGRSGDDVLQQFDVNTNAGGSTITPAAYHYGIVSCTAEEGDGFVFGGRRFVGFTAVYS